jgi:OPT family oligopeptide transporter
MAGPSESTSGAIPNSALKQLTPEQLATWTPEQKDRWWYENVYQGDKMPQLTLRAVLMGGILGMVMAASNLYTTLAIGWAFGVAITACVMSFVIWNGLRFLSGGSLGKLSILEQNCMASTASAAGYSTGSTLATMFGALLLLQDPTPGQTAADIKNWNVQPIWVVVMFTFCTGLMGVFLAVPLKRQMINHEQLRFPSGIATAETLSSLYSQSKDAIKKAYVLIWGIGIGAIIGILNTTEKTLLFLDRFIEWIKSTLGINIRLPEMIPHDGFTKYHGVAPSAFGFESSMLLIAAGVITRMRACISMFIGSALLYLVVGPWLLEKDLGVAGTGWVQQTINGTTQWVYDKAARDPNVVRNIDLNAAGTVLRFTVWSLWGGTAILVFASLTAIALQWKTVARAFTGLGQRRDLHATDAKLKEIEVPFSWMLMGMVPITIAMLFVQIVAFNISWWAGLVAVGLSFFLALVACRATGETDTTPIGAMGKVMQLLFAVLHPGQIVPNLASAGIAANSASSSADLLTELKSGYLLGANPRRQFLAQFFGVFFGTLAVVPIWFLMVPTKEALEKFSAPGTRQWEAVARVLTKGIDQLPETAKWAILIGASVGIIIPILEKLFPKARPYLPSAMGLGLAWVIPFSSALGFFVGAVIGWLWERFHARTAALYSIALAAGLIAGESLIKAVIAMTATAVGLMGPAKVSEPTAAAATPPAIIQPAQPTPGPEASSTAPIDAPAGPPK